MSYVHDLTFLPLILCPSPSRHCFFHQRLVYPPMRTHGPRAMVRLRCPPFLFCPPACTPAFHTAMPNTHEATRYVRLSLHPRREREKESASLIRPTVSLDTRRRPSPSPARILQTCSVLAVARPSAAIIALEQRRRPHPQSSPYMNLCGGFNHPLLVEPNCWRGAKVWISIYFNVDS
jgi:hypothetical protein